MFAIFIPSDARIISGFSYDCAGLYDTAEEAQEEADAYNRNFTDRNATVVKYSPDLLTQCTKFVADGYFDWLEGRFRVEAGELHRWPYEAGELPDEYEYN